MLNLEKLTKEELLSLGFRLWSKTSGVLLVPAVLWDQIPDGVELTCIDGRTVIKGKDYIDDDTRAGLLAYGIKK